MKRFLCLILGGASLAFTLAACSSTNQTGSTPNVTTRTTPAELVRGGYGAHGY